MSVHDEARRDAREYARAQMYYGEGAGTRRKLIDATVTSKILKDEGYARAFRSEYNKQDLGEHAMKAHRERIRKDAAESLNRNVKGLAVGDLHSVSPSFVTLILLGLGVHQLGLDKKIVHEAKVQRARLNLWWRERRKKAHNLTTVR